MFMETCVYYSLGKVFTTPMVNTWLAYGPQEKVTVHWLDWLYHQTSAPLGPQAIGFSARIDGQVSRSYQRVAHEGFN